MGDFNVDANQFDTYARLDSLMTSYGYKQVITMPTRVTDDTASIIDPAYVTNVNKIREDSVSDIAFSDHSLIGITWCFSASHKDRPSSIRNIHKSISYRSTKNFNINHYIYDFHRLSGLIKMTMIMSMTMIKHLMTHSFMLLTLMPQLCRNVSKGINNLNGLHMRSLMKWLNETH